MKPLEMTQNPLTFLDLATIHQRNSLAEIPPRLTFPSLVKPTKMTRNPPVVLDMVFLFSIESPAAHHILEPLCNPLDYLSPIQDNSHNSEVLWLCGAPGFTKILKTQLSENQSNFFSLL